MKKVLLLLFLSIFLISCEQSTSKHIDEKKYVIEKEITKDKQDTTYINGDIVYLKPDSLRCTIVYVNNEGESYDIQYYIAGESNQSRYISPVYFFKQKQIKKSN